LAQLRLCRRFSTIQHTAEDTRLLAAQLIDPEAKATILKIADEYERLAHRALIRMKEENAPK
jgi:hypothetical protein